jgi:hypothetical protein
MVRRPGYETTARSGPAPAPDEAALARHEHRLRHGLSRPTAGTDVQSRLRALANSGDPALALRARQLQLLNLAAG